MKKLKLNFDRILLAISIVMSLIFIIMLGTYNIIPLKYFIGIIITLIGYNALLFYLLVYKTKFGKFTKKKITGYVLTAILIMLLIVILYFSNTAMNFLKGISGEKYKEENFIVFVLKESSFNKLEDINKLGYTKNELSNINQAVEKIKKSSIETKEYEIVDKMFEDLFNKTTDAVMIEESLYNVLNEQFKYEDKLREIDRITIRTEIEIAKEIDVTKKPFVVYISGIDTYGNIATVSRSDVNIVAVVNPKIKQVLLVSAPRDYYVQLRGTTGYRDKLTHAGVYGIETSIGTLEDLLKTDINYYARVNFSSVVKIVDALGGIDVYSKYDFTSSYDANNMYHFSKGYNHMNGQQALAFARERHQIAGGDRVRGLNQQAIIDGVLKKATSPAIMPAFSKILNSLKGTFQTSMDDKDIQKLIKMQLDDMAKWNVTSFGLDGSDSSNYTYSYQGQKLYVMEPDINSVNQAQQMIDKVLAGESLEGSYSDDKSGVNNPTHVVPKPAPVLKGKPVITFNSETITIKEGEQIDLLSGVTATDKEDGAVSVTVNISDTSILKEGNHVITYTAKDSDNNIVTKERTIIVIKNSETNVPPNTPLPQDPIEKPTEPIVPEEKPTEPIVPEEKPEISVPESKPTPQEPNIEIPEKEE